MTIGGCDFPTESVFQLPFLSPKQNLCRSFLRGSASPPLQDFDSRCRVPHWTTANGSWLEPELVSAGKFSTRISRFLFGYSCAGWNGGLFISEGLNVAALARKSFPGTDPIGRVLFGPYLPKRPVKIVGVVGDVRQMAQQEPLPEIYLPVQQHPYWGSDLSIVVRTAADPGRIAQAMRKKVRDLGPEVPVQFTTLSNAHGDLTVRVKPSSLCAPGRRRRYGCPSHSNAGNPESLRQYTCRFDRHSKEPNSRGGLFPL
jgi:hypothetical protein